MDQESGQGRSYQAVRIIACTVSSRYSLTHHALAAQGFPWVGHGSWRLGAGVGGGWEGERRGGGIKGIIKQEFLFIVQELCESRGGRPGLPF